MCRMISRHLQETTANRSNAQFSSSTWTAKACHTTVKALDMRCCLLASRRVDKLCRDPENPVLTPTPKVVQNSALSLGPSLIAKAISSRGRLRRFPLNPLHSEECLRPTSQTAKTIWQPHYFMVARRQRRPPPRSSHQDFRRGDASGERPRSATTPLLGS